MFLWRRATKTTVTAKVAQWLRGRKSPAGAPAASPPTTGDNAARGGRPRLYVVPARHSGTTRTR